MDLTIRLQTSGSGPCLSVDMSSSTTASWVCTSNSAGAGASSSAMAPTGVREQLRCGLTGEGAQLRHSLAGVSEQLPHNATSACDQDSLGRPQPCFCCPQLHSSVGRPKCHQLSLLGPPAGRITPALVPACPCSTLVGEEG